MGGGQIEDLDASLGGNDEPVEALREEDAVDGGVALLLGEPLAVDDVPHHDLAVARPRCQVGRVLHDVEGGNLSSVSLEGVLECHVNVVPNLDGLVPGGGDAQAGLLGVVEAHHRHRIRVHVLLHGVLALGTRVPNLDLLVETACDDLAIVSGQVNRKDVSLVADKLRDSASTCHVPQTAGTVPGGGEGEARVAGELDFGHEV